MKKEAAAQRRDDDDLCANLLSLRETFVAQHGEDANAGKRWQFDDQIAGIGYAREELGVLASRQWLQVIV